jgi:hypothetical protein
MAQRVPHAPQLFSSVDVSMHTPPHAIVEPGHAEQAPIEHVWPSAH